MKVVHVTEAFEGGVIEFLRCLTTATPEIDYTIVYGRPQYFEKAKGTFPNNVSFIPWTFASREISPVKDAKATWELHQILRRLKPYHILHLHSSKAGILGRVAGLFLGKQRVIYAPHAAAFLRKDVSSLTRRLYITMEQMGAILPGKVVGVSKSEAEAYQKIGIKASFVNNGKYYPSKGEKPVKENDEFRIVSTGRILIQKNPVLFNQIAERFKSNYKVKFVWVGEGPDRDKLTSPNIEITGWVDKSRVEYELIHADLYLSTALWEGLPYAVLEGMSMNLPLVLSRCPGNTDVVLEGENGYLYDSADQAEEHIKYIINNPSRAREMGEKGYQYLIEEFGVDKMAAGYRVLYAELAITL
jgi:glycosyltransferase involved in cell wall biosynthesis